jgi:tRNA-modifying protein YgfZ
MATIDVVSVGGADARSYLQGQLSQDMAVVDRDGHAWSWLLQPDGKVSALLHVVRQGDEHYDLEVDTPFGEVVLARLKRFMLRVKVELTLVSDQRDGEDESDRDRIERKWPSMGNELDETTIPNAAGINDRTVSFTKGCYTGQELVARVDSRGNNTPTSLRLLRATSGHLASGAIATTDGKNTVVVTSTEGDIALGWVARAIEVGSSVAFTDGTIATVE